jgi:hypothetical protein
MSNTQLLKTKLFEIEKILLHVDRLYDYCKYLNNLEPSYERLIRNKYPILGHARVSFVIVIILDLCKLYNKDEKYSLKKLLKIFINDYKKIKFAKQIDKEKILDIFNDLEDENIVATINKLRTLRDNYYAHLDSVDLKLIEIMPNFKDFRLIIDVGHKIVNILNEYLNDTQTAVLINDRDKADNILIDLLSIQDKK